jgi:unsaturated chondroitin disaccharide hydrolase
MSAAQPELAAALKDAIGLLVRSLPQLRAASEQGMVPHVTEAGGWKLISPLGSEERALTGLPWTGGFVAGQLWLASRMSGDGQLAAEAAAVTELLAPRAAQPNTHDLGFLFWPSAVLGHLVTGDPRYRDLALRAARSLTGRVLPSGVIQVVGALDDPKQRGRTIVDTLPNLTLLWWAEREGVARAGEVARSHVEASLPASIRADGSTFHAVRFANDGSVLERGTVNGLATDSTWARGQAWTIHGLVSAYRATGHRETLAAAERTASFFLDRLPPGLIPPWDFDAAPSAPTDSSAAAIVASALLDLGGEWRDRAMELLSALVTSCLNRGDEDGLLLHSCYRYTVGEGIDCATDWGDFFLLDALVHAVEPASRLDPLASPG